MSLPAPLNKKLYKLPKAHGYMKLKGNGRFTKGYVRLGDTTSIVQRNSFENELIWGADSPTRTVRDTWLVQKSGEIDLGIRMMTALATSLIYLTDPNSYFTQAVVAAGEEFLTDELAPTEAVVVPFIDGVITLVTSLDVVPVEYLEGQHYVFDPASGIFEIVAHPDGVVTNDDGGAAVMIEHGAPAITADEKRGYGGIMQLDNGLESSLLFNQIGKGPNQRLRYHSVSFLNTEDIVIGNDENTPMSVSLKGTLSEDPSKPDGFRWGDVLELKRAA